VTAASRSLASSPTRKINVAPALRRHPLAAFFVLTYTGSWVAWSPWVLSQSGIGVLPYELPSAVIAGIKQVGFLAGPLAAAYVMTRVDEGHDGIRRFWARLLLWRVHPLWYVLALLVVPVAMRIGYLLDPDTRSALGVINLTVIGVLAGTFLISLLGGPVQEEPGWRGFALPRLQQRQHPMSAALVLGVIHCFWHAPLWLTDEWATARQDPSQYLAYLVLVVSMSFVMSWLANGTRGSMLLVILAHTGFNWSITLTGGDTVRLWPAANGLMALALVTISVTHGRLGHAPHRLPAAGDAAPLRPALKR
jgi:membrane protease YdiL (CAAX protease family)